MQKNFWGEFHGGTISQRGRPEGNYLGVIVRQVVVLGVIIQG